MGCPRTSGHPRAERGQAAICEGSARDRRPADRAVRQDPAAGDLPPGRGGRAREHRAVRRTRAVTGAHPHLPDHPPGAVERARRRARRRAGGGRAGALVPLPGPASAARRCGGHHGPLRPVGAADPPGARTDHGLAGSGRPGRDPAAQEDRPDARRQARSGHGDRAPLPARAPQAGAAEGRMARRGRGRLRRRGGPPHRAQPRELASPVVPGRSGRRVLGRRIRCGGAAVRRREDAGRCGRDGPGRGDHVDPGDEHRRRPAMAARTAGPDITDRGGDRRVLRRAQGDPSRHHRHLPGDDLQDRRRLGLTATLVREDGREGDVFSLIGPKRYDAPWKDIESQGWIAPAECIEVRVTLTDAERLSYAIAEPEDRYKIASTARTKMPVVRSILDRHPGEPTLVIGAYLDQLEELGEELQAPIIQGSTRNAERERLYDAFRAGEINTLVVSKVANFSIDLPEATVAIQVSGTFGSRQEEAQRLGRLLRPKGDGRQAHFYSVVSRDTNDQEFAARRQRFLAEQGYAYRIVDADDLLGPAVPGTPE